MFAAVRKKWMLWRLTRERWWFDSEGMMESNHAADVGIK